MILRSHANRKLRILICDGFRTHETLEILEFCFEKNIILCRLPSHTSHKSQPCHVSVFCPLKTAYQDKVERLYRGGPTNINEEHFTTVYGRARVKAMTKKNILAGRAKIGLFPFNPNRIRPETCQRCPVGFLLTSPLIRTTSDFSRMQITKPGLVGRRNQTSLKGPGRTAKGG